VVTQTLYLLLVRVLQPYLSTFEVLVPVHVLACQVLVLVLVLGPSVLVAVLVLICQVLVLEPLILVVLCLYLNLMYWYWCLYLFVEYLTAEKYRELHGTDTVKKVPRCRGKTVVPPSTGLPRVCRSIDSRRNWTAGAVVALKNSQ